MQQLWSQRTHNSELLPWVQLHALATDTGKTEAAVDSSASVHYCPDHNKFMSYHTIAEKKIHAMEG
jgi:hypothetical protein